MSDARRKAESLLAQPLFFKETMAPWVETIRALLAEEPEAANFIRCALPRGECCHQRIPAVLPLEAPECNDGDDCCRYCGRGLQPCGACKPAPPAYPQTVLDTIRWVLNDAHYKAPEQIAGCWHSVWAPKLREALDAMPVGCTTPPADAATEAVREAAERLLEDYEGVEDMLLPDTAGKVLRLRTALAARGGDV